MAEKIKKNSTAIDNKCPNCGSKLDYDPKLEKFKCKYCESTFTIEELEKKLNTAATKEKNKHEHLEEDEGDFFQYNCPDCGAIIVADAQTSATFCVYCGNTAILKNKLAGKFHPKYIIPFKKNVDDAKEAFKGLSRGRMFVPKSFINENNIEKIRGIYIPFWLYDISFDGEIKASGRRVTTWTVGRTHYTKTDTYEMIRAGSMKYDKVPVDGSTRFDNDMMNSIEPFNYKELKEYNHAYLSGFLAEKYDIDEKECYSDAKKRVTKSSEDKLLNTCIYRPATIKSKNYVDKNTEFYYVLLPVYMVNVKYMGKMYTFAMNGQTGKFIGNIPLDKKKVLLTTIISFAIVFGIIELIVFVAYKFGGA